MVETEADKILKEIETLDFFVDLFTYKEPDKDKEIDAREQLSESRVKAHQYLKDCEEFLEFLEKIEKEISSICYGNDIEFDYEKLDNKIEHYQSEIKKIKEILK